jgi:copper chaperone CopZ
VETRFVVRGAGCESCAERLARALAPLGTVDGIEIDEAADAAAVTLVSGEALNQEVVDAALKDASVGSGGHEYGVEAGSWNVS